VETGTVETTQSISLKGPRQAALVRHASAVDSLRDRLRAYVRAQASGASGASEGQVDHDRWRRQQPEWEQRWAAPRPGWIRDGILTILDRHGILDPAAPGRFADISAHEPLQDWGAGVLVGAIAAGPGARVVIDYGGRPPRFHGVLDGAHVRPGLSSA
jgi:hypothetical protein